MAPFIKSMPMTTYGSLPGFPAWIDNVLLDDAAAHSYVAPEGCNAVFVVANGASWGSITGTAAVPVADIADGTGALYLPSGIQIKLDEGETLSLIRAGSSTVTVSIGVYK